MNGINYQTLLSNTGMYDTTQSTFKTKAKTATNSPLDNAKLVGKNPDSDTVEIDGKSREIPKAGYDRPKVTVRESDEKELQIKEVDEDGIEVGVELSDAARDLLAELKEKYTNMDFKVLSWSTDEEQAYYASQTDKDYSVLIDPAALEAMAADEEVRAQYESVLESAGQTSETLKEELGEDVDKIESFQVTIDQDGKVSYMVQLIKDFDAANKAADDSDEETIEEEQAKKLEEKREEKRSEAKKIKADSLEELIAAIKEELGTEDVVVVEEAEVTYESTDTE